MNIDEKIKILIVDDRPENVLSLEAIIESEQYELVKAYSGEEALKCLLKDHYAAILLDVQMPGMDGFATAKIIRAREKTKHIPILFITANNMENEHIFMGYSVGAVDYILKPLDPLILKAKVERFVELYKMQKRLAEQAKELAEQNKKIEFMAYHDSLTKLPNRRFFNEKLLSEVNEARKSNTHLGLMYLDLDRFNYVNEALGHTIGDLLLQEVAKRIVKQIREQDIVARINGDEFTIILPNTNRESSLEVAERILEAFSKPYLIDQYELHMTTCIGLSVFPFDGEDAFTLIKGADSALHRAKEQGKDRFNVFHTGMNINSYRTFLIQNDLRKAIEANEFELVYQPRVNVETGKITCAEALIRWNHPKWGKLLPNDFIPIAEETGLIIPIGEWVLKQVCSHLNEWREKGYSVIPISVNFSSQQFLQRNLILHMNKIINALNIAPELLEIEITESVFLGNEEIIVESLNKLRNMGMKISLDDFGTGYSSLGYLRRFPIDKIKVDKTFIQDITSNKKNSLAIVSSISTLAQQLGISIVAEGVETEEQYKIMKELQYTEVQGYYFSPPLSVSDFEPLLVADKEDNRALILDQPQKPKVEDEFSNVFQVDNEEVNNGIVEVSLYRLKEMYSISAREAEVFRLLIDGLTNKEISKMLYISEHTVKNHITKIFQKLNVTDRLQAIAMVYEMSLEERKSLYS